MSTIEPFIAQPSDEPRASPGVFLKAVLVVTGIAGTMDIIAAHLSWWAKTGKFPTMLFKGIAGGALGIQRAMQGGAGTMALGIFFHYFISFAFTLLFFLLFPRVPLLRKNRYAVGTAYAIITWTIMTYIVLPVSKMPWSRPDLASKQLYLGVAVFVVVFGLPIVFGAAWFYKRHPQAK
jgi:hypothetical protein